MCVFYLARGRTRRLCQGAPNARAALVSAGVASAEAAASASATGPFDAQMNNGPGPLGAVKRPRRFL
jgi:hypothetical protein